jgi:hypothetical protein
MNLRPVLNHEDPPRGEIANALMHFEARCQIQGRLIVTEGEVRDFLRAEYPETESAFRPTHLRPCALP